MKIPSREYLTQSGSTLMTTLVILGITGFLIDLIGNRQLVLDFVTKRP